VEDAEVKVVGIEAVPGHENRVMRYLQQLDTARMTELVKGCVVCELDRTKIEALSKFPGVKRVMPIKDLCDVGALAAPARPREESFAPGDLVRIAHWVSAPVIGFLREWDGEHGVVDVALFGRAIPVRVTRPAIEPVPLPDQWA
jgi:transcription antitermination factor NusG